MKYLMALILIVLVLLSAAAGVAKVLNMPQEVQFFEQAGLSASWLLPLGIIQILGALLAIYGPTRRMGSITMALGFLLSAAAIFMTGNMVFGAISLLPVFFSLFAAYRAGGHTAQR